LELSPQLKKLVSQLHHEVQRLEAFAPQASFHPIAKTKERKLQILDEGLDSNKEGEVVSFFNELDTERRTMLVISISLFNEVSTETPKLSSYWFHFLMILKSKNHAQSWFHFLLSLKSKKHAQS
jgi:hypothetical protein